jgi:23S rRNA (adenine2503-C2)-methyltransferase
MKVIAKTNDSDVATVYLLDMGKGRMVECVESRQPPFSKTEKWVIIVSVLYGCPIECPMCDAGGSYLGRLTAEEIWFQIEYMIRRHFPEKPLRVGKFKIQFARMGEPSLNPAVLDVLEALPDRIPSVNLIPCVSTIAPRGREPFFEKLRWIKQRYFSEGRFQLQFSVHATDSAIRDRLIPAAKWDLAEIARYGRTFVKSGDRKITLNFALAEEHNLEPSILREYFDPPNFLIKITPVNPTINARKNGIGNMILDQAQAGRVPVIEALRKAGFEVIVSLGELEENKIGSNCGQYVRTYLSGLEGTGSMDSYLYPLQEIE